MKIPTLVCSMALLAACAPAPAAAPIIVTTAPAGPDRAAIEAEAREAIAREVRAYLQGVADERERWVAASASVQPPLFDPATQ